ncbi:hypothetical protein CVT26_001623, partial [Gymnopilus dilepis]
MSTHESVLNTPANNQKFTDDSRVLPFAVACLTVLLSIVQLIVKQSKVQRAKSQSRQVVVDGSSSLNAPPSAPRFAQRLKDHVHSFGNFNIFGFMVARLLGNLGLFSLSMYTLSQCKLQNDERRLLEVFHRCPEGFMTITYCYASILALLAISSKRLSSCIFSSCSGVLLTALAVYTYRDLWPLATYDMRPIDLSEGNVLWAKVALLIFTAVLIPLSIPRVYVPLDPKNPMLDPNPEQTASIISLMTYTHLDPVVFLRGKVPHLRANQLFPLADYDYAKYRTEKAFPRLDVFRGAKRRHLFFGLMDVYRREFFLMGLTIVSYSHASLGAPVGINRVLRYMETGGAGATVRPWFWVLWLFFGPMLQSLSFQWYIYNATAVLVRTEGLITQLVFEHSLRIRLKAQPAGDSDVEGKARKASDNLTGRIHNLVTTDLGNLVRGKDFLFIGMYNNISKEFLLAHVRSTALFVPLEFSLCMIFLYQVLGWSSFVGVAAMIMFLPIPVYLAKRLRRVEEEKMKRSDARVQAVSETVGVLRMIKLFGWETKMADRLQKLREEELKWLWKGKLIDQIVAILSYFLPLWSMLVTYVVYVSLMKEELNASKIFSSMTVFSILREQLYKLLWETATMIQAKVSLDRVREFLHDTELLDSFSTNSARRTSVGDELQNDASDDKIGFRNAAFAWTAEDEDETVTPSRRQFRLRIEGELTFKPEKINLIVGPTGSGKTAILMALLGEMHFIPMGPDSWFNLPRNRGVAYAAQESWVQNDTIRNNILFGNPFDEERYHKVIKQCALERDLELFEAGDETEVGERGITLSSGGQKARITLARAIYSSAKIVLLDDVFAALDVHTCVSFATYFCVVTETIISSSWIIDHCFRGELVKNRTILLVTHSIYLASRVADHVVSVGKDGRVKDQRAQVSSILAHDSALAEEAQHDKEIVKVAKEEIDQDCQKPKDGKLIMTEEVVEGHVTWKSFKLFLSSMGGKHPLLFFLAITGAFFLNSWWITFQSWFLGYWGTQYEGRDPSEVESTFYICAYLASLSGIL